jgi:hypothetical protein
VLKIVKNAKKSLNLVLDALLIFILNIAIFVKNINVSIAENNAIDVKIIIAIINIGDCCINMIIVAYAIK